MLFESGRKKTAPLNSVADPKLKFRIRFRIRIRPQVSFGSVSGFEYGSESGFESGFESRMWIRIRILDLDPNQKLAKTSFFGLIFKHKKSAFLSSVTWLGTKCAINLRCPSPLQVKDENGRIRIHWSEARHRTKMSWIHNLRTTTCKCEICIIVYNYLILGWK